jgi:transcriptional regulator with PAS, ATPase and Fis domain
MTPAMQVKLLRALQEKRIRPVGSDEEHSADARVIAATNQDLQKLLKEKRFREDLYYRINVISLRIPSLRERREDIPLLAHHFLEKYARLLGKDVPVISNEAMKRLEAYDWPGNVRQLENVLERAMALIDGNVVEAGHLPEEVLGVGRPLIHEDVVIPEDEFSLNDAVESFRAAYIKKALELENGVMVRAAERLGITFRSMRYFVKKYHMQAKG